MTRTELLEQLFDLYWNKTAVLESDIPQYGYVLNSDLTALDDVCEQIEALGEPQPEESHPEWKACKA